MKNDTLAILLHGFNVSDGGAKSIGRLIPYLESRKADVKMLRYGWFGLLQTRFFNEEIAEKLARLIDRKVMSYNQIIVIGHSNGCAIAHMASHMCAQKIFRFIYINPALKKDYAPGATVRQVDVWHNNHDKAVMWSKLLFWRASERPWGVMGNAGYQGHDTRFVNYDTAEDFGHIARGHSGVFKDRNIKFYGPLIAGMSLRPEK